MLRRNYLLFAILFVLALALSASVAAQDEDGTFPAQDEDSTFNEEEYSTAPVLVGRTLSVDGQTLNIEVEIPVQHDTFVTSGLPDTNWGLAAELREGYNLTNNWGAERMLMRFDLSSIPQQAVINSAIFRIYQTQTIPANDPPLGYVARFLNSDWSEETVTWNNNQPDWGSIFVSGEITNLLGWKEVDATDLIKPWVSGQRPNYGFIVIANETPAQRERVFTAREAGDDNFPNLLVDYDVDPDDTPPEASVEPLPQFSGTSFTVSWSGEDNPGGSGIDYYDVQYQISGGAWVNWLVGTRETSAVFTGGANGVLYGFRARAVDRAGNVQPFSPDAQAQTLVDTISPSASVDPLPPCTYTQALTLTWDGEDNPGGSGIATFDLQYQIDGGDWQNWLIGTTQTSVQATGLQDGSTFGARVRATDNAGNVQPWSPVAQASTTISNEPLEATVEQITPAITDQDSFDVSWEAETSSCATVQSYDVRYRVGQGPWMEWLAGTTMTSATFDISGLPDGNYQFEARALDSQGRVEDWTGMPEAFVIVRRSPPFFETLNYLPAVFKQP